MDAIYSCLPLLGFLIPEPVYCREYHVINLYLDESRRRVELIYPTFNQCSSSDDLLLQLDYSYSSSWATIFNRFLFQVSGKSSHYGEEVFINNIGSAKRVFVLVATILYWVLIYGCIAFLSALLIPILGAICFIFIAVLLYINVLALKLVGRQMMIGGEKVRRWRERIVVPKRLRRLYRRKKFTLPYVLRRYSDEEIPTGLEESTSESSSATEEEEEEERLVLELERMARMKEHLESLYRIPVTREGDQDSNIRLSVFGPAHTRVKVSTHKAKILTPAKEVEFKEPEKPLKGVLKRTKRRSTLTMEPTNPESSIVTRVKGRPKVAVFGRATSKHRHSLAPDVTETRSHKMLVQSLQARKPSKSRRRQKDNTVPRFQLPTQASIAKMQPKVKVVTDPDPQSRIRRRSTDRSGERSPQREPSRTIP